MLGCQNDDVAEWDGWARGEEQRLDEAHGHRPQGEEAPRLRRRIRRGSSYQPVSPLWKGPCLRNGALGTPHQTSLIAVKDTHLTTIPDFLGV